MQIGYVRLLVATEQKKEGKAVVFCIYQEETEALNMYYVTMHYKGWLAVVGSFILRQEIRLRRMKNKGDTCSYP